MTAMSDEVDELFSAISAECDFSPLSLSQLHRATENLIRAHKDLLAHRFPSLTVKWRDKAVHFDHAAAGFLAILCTKLRIFVQQRYPFARSIEMSQRRVGPSPDVTVDQRSAATDEKRRAEKTRTLLRRRRYLARLEREGKLIPDQVRMLQAMRQACDRIENGERLKAVARALNLSIETIRQYVAIERAFRNDSYARRDRLAAAEEKKRLRGRPIDMGGPRRQWIVFTPEMQYREIEQFRSSGALAGA